MADKVQSKPKKVEKFVFHLGLIKLLVLEELKKMNQDWNTFLFLVGYNPKEMATPSARKSTPSSKEKMIHLYLLKLFCKREKY